MRPGTPPSLALGDATFAKTSRKHRVNRASICLIKLDGIVPVLTSAAKLYCPVEYFEQALTQSLTSGRKELLAGITPFSP